VPVSSSVRGTVFYNILTVYDDPNLCIPSRWTRYCCHYLATLSRCVRARYRRAAPRTARFPGSFCIFSQQEPRAAYAPALRRRRRMVNCLAVSGVLLSPARGSSCGAPGCTQHAARRRNGGANGTLALHLPLRRAAALLRAAALAAAPGRHPDDSGGTRGTGTRAQQTGWQACDAAWQRRTLHTALEEGRRDVHSAANHFPPATRTCLPAAPLPARDVAGQHCSEPGSCLPTDIFERSTGIAVRHCLSLPPSARLCHLSGTALRGALPYCLPGASHVPSLGSAAFYTVGEGHSLFAGNVEEVEEKEVAEGGTSTAAGLQYTPCCTARLQHTTEEGERGHGYYHGIESASCYI